MNGMDMRMDMRMARKSWTWASTCKPIRTAFMILAKWRTLEGQASIDDIAAFAGYREAQVGIGMIPLHSRKHAYQVLSAACMTQHGIWK